MKTLAILLLVAAAALAQATGDEFTIVAVPDVHVDVPQSVWTQSVNWIVSNQAAWNIKAVIGLGDYVSDGAASTQWDAVMPGWGAIRSLGLPIIMVRGNHDTNLFYSTTGPGTWTNWNSRVADWITGLTAVYPASYSSIDSDRKAAQQYLRVDVNTASSGTFKFGLVTIDHFATAASVSTARAWMAGDRDRQFIVAVHDFVSFIPQTVTGGHACIGGEDTDSDCVPQSSRGEQDGAAIWNGIKDIPGIVGIFDGHKHVIRSATLTGTYGNAVQAISGAFTELMLIKFSPQAQKFAVTMLRPQDGTYDTAWGAQGTVAFNWPHGSRVRRFGGTVRARGLVR